jgi:integrase
MNETAFDLLSNLSRKNSLVFPSHRKEGEPFRDPKKAFATAIRLAGIEHLRFHDLRHTFATRFYQATKDVVALKEVLGHSNLRTIMKYVHVSQDHVDGAMKAYEASLCQFGANTSAKNAKPEPTSANEALAANRRIQ